MMKIPVQTESYDKQEVAVRFVNEKLGLHWQVDESKKSFERLICHLEKKTNEKPFFEEALKSLNLDCSEFAGDLAVADIGAGVCWPSAIIARHPKVRIVYAVDPSENRLRHGRFVVKHFGMEDKVRIGKGTFTDPRIPEKVDIVILCGSLHHCYNEQMPQLFSNIKKLLKPTGKILITNEHYVDSLWVIKRAISCFVHLKDPSRFYRLTNLRVPDPFGGEHWRTKREINFFMEQNGFSAVFFMHKGDICTNKASFYHQLGWHYYHAIASLKMDRG